MERLIRAIAASVLCGFTAPSTAAQASWSLRLALDDPLLEPAAVQVAIFDRDPVPGFRARLARSRSWHLESLERAEDEARRESLRAAFVTVSWDLGFADVTGDHLYLLTDELTYSTGSPAGRRFVVTKIRRTAEGPACWSVPVETGRGEGDNSEEARVTLTGANRSDLFAIYDAVMAGEDTTSRVEEPAAPGDGPPPEVSDLDLARIAELYRITDTHGEAIWPEFDARTIPVALNLEDRRELLVGHPHPPAQYTALEGRDVEGVPTLLREGVSRYGPQGGGWAVDLAGEQTVYVCPKPTGSPTERYLTLLLHEAFHVHQQRYRERATGPGAEPPTDDPLYAALIGLESRVLRALLDEPDGAAARELAEMFVAVRHERHRGLSEALVRSEGELEYGEGTASYSEARFLQLAVEAGGFPPADDADPDHDGFAEAAADLSERLDRVLPPPGEPITFFHAQYNLGMAQCLALDRLRPGWKEAMRERGATQFALLERELPLDAEQERERLAAARERFGFAELLEEQRRLVDERLALIRGYLEAPGRRYRVRHGDLTGRFLWKPEGPVYDVPASFGTEPGGGRATLWVGGIRRFERGSLVLESGDVPVLFRGDYLEWIDAGAAPEESRFVVRSENQEGDVLLGVELETDGFTLTAPRARIEEEGVVVWIVPLPDE